MRRSPFLPAFEHLPATIPIFPLTGVLLLPRGQLPLNIFEPRYIAMVDDALSSDRLIGMIQPADPASRANEPPVYEIGCAGRITSFDETEDGRYLITLTGVSRFRLGDELPTIRGYRRVTADWQPFRGDLGVEPGLALDRERLCSALGVYLKRHGISVNWEAIHGTPDERLVTSLCMICPFEPPEKQALLEASSWRERADTMLSLIEMAVIDKEGGEASRH